MNDIESVKITIAPPTAISIEWNWIKCIERLPSSDTAILFIAENRIYVGSMSYAESWSASDLTNITKHYSFKADIFLKEEECCEGHIEPLEVEFIERALSWDLSSVSYWMPLPSIPKDEK